MNRQKANLEIANIIFEAILNNPDWRFGQLLRNLSVVHEYRMLDAHTGWLNGFNDESVDTLKAVKKAAEELSIIVPDVDAEQLMEDMLKNEGFETRDEDDGE